MLSAHAERQGDAGRPVSAVGIVIPARNEVGRIRRAIEAVIASCRSVRPVCTILVVDDGSTDGTRAVALDALRFHCGPAHVLAVDVGRAGTARRIGCEAFSATIREPAAAWVLSTDADSTVPNDWVARFLDHHRSGEVAVAGVVDLSNDSDGRAVAERWAADYGATIGPDGTHPHVHAANLGVRLDMYERAGGFRDLERIEDIDLWDRLRDLGVCTCADAEIVVSTSARMNGRVERGFAAALERLYG